MAQEATSTRDSQELDRLLTMRDASRVLGVHGSTLRRWCRSGLLKEYRIGIGRHRRFKLADLAALVIEQRD
jgi:excisionase family DNA binding protein